MAQVLVRVFCVCAQVPRETIQVVTRIYAEHQGAVVVDMTGVSARALRRKPPAAVALESELRAVETELPFAWLLSVGVAEGEGAALTALRERRAGALHIQRLKDCALRVHAGEVHILVSASRTALTATYAAAADTFALVCGRRALQAANATLSAVELARDVGAAARVLGTQPVFDGIVTDDAAASAVILARETIEQLERVFAGAGVLTVPPEGSLARERVVLDEGEWNEGW
jgi:hypothetical protein